MEKKHYRLRYAPSPTGFLHIGNTRTALMDYLFAKHFDGDFIVRIEDTDTARNVEGAIESQFDNLQWMGIIPDESIYHPVEKYGAYQQSMKFDRYRELAQQLIDKGLAYKCFCTPEELEKDHEAQKAAGNPSPKYNLKCYHLTPEQVKENEDKGMPYSIRFHVPENKEYKWNDLVRGWTSFESENIGDFVIVKTNGIATYNFAVIVDDHDMEITTVVRGEEHISNTPKQLMLYEAMGWEAPDFAHLTLIVDENHKKLSKRSGNALFFLTQYRNQGYLPEAMFNYIALLGWSPKGTEEILSKEELIKQFDPTRFSKSPSTFDMNKMKWINSQYMKKMDDDKYVEFVRKFIDADRYNFELKDDKWVAAVLLLFKTEIDFAQQINDHLAIFFDQAKVGDKAKEQLKEIPDYEKVVDVFENKIKNMTDWSSENIMNAIKESGKEAEAKGRGLYMPIRIFATKSEHGPAIADVLFLLGKDKVLKHINDVKEEIK